MIEWERPTLETHAETLRRCALVLSVPFVSIWTAALVTGKLRPLPDLDWAAMFNTNSWGINCIDDVTKASDVKDKNWFKIQRVMELGGRIEAPIVLSYRGIVTYLVSGNTRLCVAKAVGLSPTVFYIPLWRPVFIKM